MIEILGSCRVMHLALKGELSFYFLEDYVDNAALQFDEGAGCHLLVVGGVEKRGQFVDGQDGGAVSLTGDGNAVDESDHQIDDGPEEGGVAYELPVLYYPQEISYARQQQLLGYSIEIICVSNAGFQGEGSLVYYLRTFHGGYGFRHDVD